MATMKRKLVGTCPVCGKQAFGVVGGKAVHGWIIYGKTVVPNPAKVCSLANGQTLKDRHMETVDLDSAEIASRCVILHNIDPTSGSKVTRKVTVKSLSKSAGKPGLLARLVKAVKNE
jgi:hypothetical protein